MYHHSCIYILKGVSAERWQYYYWQALFDNTSGSSLHSLSSNCSTQLELSQSGGVRRQMWVATWSNFRTLAFSLGANYSTGTNYLSGLLANLTIQLLMSKSKRNGNYYWKDAADASSPWPTGTFSHVLFLTILNHVIKLKTLSLDKDLATESKACVLQNFAILEKKTDFLSFHCHCDVFLSVYHFNMWLIIANQLLTLDLLNSTSRQFQTMKTNVTDEVSMAVCFH